MTDQTEASQTTAADWTIRYKVKHVACDNVTTNLIIVIIKLL